MKFRDVSQEHFLDSMFWVNDLEQRNCRNHNIFIEYGSTGDENEQYLQKCIWPASHVSETNTQVFVCKLQKCILQQFFSIYIINIELIFYI